MSAANINPNRLSTTEARLEDIYTHLWAAHTDEFGILDQSLKPRSWAMLFDIVAAWNIDANATVLDVGCGRGNHCLDFATRFGCHAVGLDRVFSPLGRTRSIAREQGYGDLVAYLQGSIDHLPFSDAAFDLVWCRDVLVHVRDLTRALGECALGPRASRHARRQPPGEPRCRAQATGRPTTGSPHLRTCGSASVELDPPVYPEVFSDREPVRQIRRHRKG